VSGGTITGSTGQVLSFDLRKPWPDPDEYRFSVSIPEAVVPEFSPVSG
jgi:hypothetical protein